MEFILVPGAWAGGWLWDDVAFYLKNKGHKVHQLTLSGLSGNCKPETIDLNRHIEDVENYILKNTFKSVCLVGHSYSGIVVGQVASWNKVNVHHSIFVEAFLPITGKSLLDVSGLSIDEETRIITNNNGMWPAPTLEELSSQISLTQQQINQLVSKQRSQPGKTVTDSAKLQKPLAEVSATFIAHDDWLSSSRENKLIEDLRKSKHWNFKTIDGGHWPMLTMPETLAEHINLSIV